MIFTTMAEEQRVYDTVHSKGTFDDLNDDQMMAIRGIYWSIEALENEKYEYKTMDGDSILEQIQAEVAVETIEGCIMRLEREAMTMYVSFTDDNYGEEDD